jgi:hypothetical protein
VSTQNIVLFTEIGLKKTRNPKIRVKSKVIFVLNWLSTTPKRSVGREEVAPPFFILTLHGASRPSCFNTVDTASNTHWI